VPALAFLLALLVLTAIVWWRVLHRDQSGSSSNGRATGTLVQSCAPSGSPKYVLPRPAGVTLKVVNGSSKDGLAASVLTELKARGFKTIGTDTVTDTAQLATLSTEVAEIHYGTAGKTNAELVGYYLAGSKLVKVSRSDAAVDVVLGMSFTKLTPQPQVNVAIARATKPC
jgi:hypothetical protein